MRRTELSNHNPRLTLGEIQSHYPLCISPHSYRDVGLDGAGSRSPPYPHQSAQGYQPQRLRGTERPGTLALQLQQARLSLRAA